MKQARGVDSPRYQVCYPTPSGRGEIFSRTSTKIMKPVKIKEHLRTSAEIHEDLRESMKIENARKSMKIMKTVTIQEIQRKQMKAKEDLRTLVNI